MIAADVSNKAVVRIGVRIAARLAALLHSTRLHDEVLALVTRLLEDIGLPAAVSIDIVRDADLKDIELSIGGRRARVRCESNEEGHPDVHSTALRIARAIHANRRYIISMGIAAAVRDGWFSSERGIFLPGLGQHAFQQYLQLYATRCLRLDRGRAPGLGVLPSAMDWTPEHCFERFAGGLSVLRVELHVPPDRVPDVGIEKALSALQDRLFYELGIRVPDIRVVIGDHSMLRLNEWMVRINDVRLPPFAGLGSREFLVNETSDRLKLLNVKARKARDPESGMEFAVVTGAKNAKTCQDAGLTTWDAVQHALLTMAASLRRHAGAMLALDGVQYELDQLQQSSPDLIRACRARFSLTTIIGVLRLLLDEEVSVRNLRDVLEAMLNVRSSMEVDFQKYIVLPPYAAAPSPVLGHAGSGDGTLADLTESVRTQLRQQIPHKYTRGSRTLVVYLMDPEVENRIAANGTSPLSDAELAQLIEAVGREVGDADIYRQGAVILTPLNVRRALRQMLETAFPQVSVLSFQELPADMNIQPIARIELGNGSKRLPRL